MKYFKIIFLFFLISSKSIAISPQLPGEIQELEKLNAESYLSKVGEHRIKIVNHLKFEQESCQNKFRPPRGTRNSQRKLLYEQKERCLALVKQWKAQYFEALKTAKKKYLLSLHKKELEGINTVLDKLEQPIKEN